MVTSHCKHCGAEIVRRGSKPGVYCSHECMYAGRRKLPPDEVVVSAYRSGMSCGEIGERYGCKAKSVQSLLARKGITLRTWKEAARVACDRGRSRGQFQKGAVPWNKGVKGIHLSRETEFKPGHKPTVCYRVETTRVRVFRKDGELHSARAFVKIAQPSMWRLRSHVMWEKAHGPIPKGMVLHYRNGDGMDDRLGNFMLVTRAEHLEIHRPEFEDKRQARSSRTTRARWERYRSPHARAGAGR